MKAFTSLFAIASLSAIAMAAPVDDAEPVLAARDGVELITRNEINARGYGCPWSTSQCSFHDVVKKCSNGRTIKPTGGSCDGLGWA
ncbi:hypothetical protein BM221_002390 [Beauveria bassiana]|uniref:Antifungal protein n=1 Tax=Beauveria bassiana TaxID=176275 RepID=A0A2N6NYF0_BEABA|nr:hypothetical protein BM221_002390 [Beauveria bassiana]